MVEYEQSSEEQNNNLELSNNNNNEEIEEEFNADNLNHKLGFKWYKTSYAFDSFITIFIFSIYPKIINDISQIKSEEFSYYIKFKNEIASNKLNKEIRFYDYI